MSHLYCECCNFQAKRPAELKRHFQTNKHRKRTKELANVSNSLANLSNSLAQISPQHKCKYCDKVYRHKSSLCKHVKYYCKKSKDEDLQELVRLLNKEIDTLNKKVNVYETEHKNLNKQINHLTKKLKIQNIGQQNIVKGNNFNTMVNNNQNINILNHKDTKYDFLTDKDYINCLRTCNHCVKNLIEKVHFNEAHPENMNIYISSMKTDYLMMYRDNNWNIVDRNYHIDSLYSSNEMQLENWYDEYKDKYPHIIQKFERYLRNREHNEVIDNVKKDILRMLYNKRKLVTKNIKLQELGFGDIDEEDDNEETQENEGVAELSNQICE